ncbi:MAG: bifunctional oligoribonuclease/PAP phosphatase NrnA [Treponema sp.]|jgi:phosphoesterase RecJ-like protein|nr:bifunctional oligoribonuclease/PAP phosphatase NrnA [Treponema sp.]
MHILTPDQISDFRDFIREHTFFFITGHKEPDGDCISSCLALASLMEHEGKPYQLLSAGPFKRPEIKDKAAFFSDTMHFMTQQERDSAGLIIADCSELFRLGDIDGDFKGLDTFILDHHRTAAAPEGAKTIIEPTVPATASIVQMLYEGIAGTLPAAVAKTLFFGLSTDTGFFRFLDGDSAEVFNSAARLVAAGADPRATYDSMTSGKPYATRKLLGVMLDHAKQYYGGKLIMTYETMEDTRKYGKEGRDSDMLYQILLAVDRVEAVVFLRQETETSCTGGFRSKDSVDVSAVAAKYGGGGHKNAAGMSVEGKLETLIPEIGKQFARILN